MSSYSSADEEYDSDEPPKLELNIDSLKDVSSKVLQAPCISARPMTRGSSHEIFALEFQKSRTTSYQSLVRSGYSCIARFARVRGTSAKEESEIATIRYVKQHTSIPVPEIYYQDLNPDNEIGAAFVLMEKIPGRHLYKIWDGLSLDHKKVALSQIASVIVQFSSLRFDKIGCLTKNGIGRVTSPCYTSPQGPFSSTLQYLESFISSDSVNSSEAKDLFGQIRTKLAEYAKTEAASYLEPPFSMIHADFDAQNMLFLDAPDGSGPKLTGLIDFEYAHTGPVYFLYEYPIFIQDVSWSSHLCTKNKALRAHFVSQIFNGLTSPKEKATFISCINSKSFLLNGFRDAFMTIQCSERTRKNSAFYYLESLKDGTGLAYSGRVDYKPEYYSKEGRPMRPMDKGL
ncbi:kinase-like domain-containing protein [Fusarium solani]|uniref:Kinase-like domain-containing protein n=1 Tax=Fusarium solani TaxID=169388 RepID=A0A9P9GUK6_FUSSL|nr:kinase-like domain-containing protein [Fusarium solani]KAH7244824.1 kinase-like domain-containing protein [Fusarium solani]